jgi:arylsulfatase A-like enzyme
MAVSWGIRDAALFAAVPALAFCLSSCKGIPFSSNRPLVVVITLDTTRVDHLGCYGYERPTTPNIDELAADSLVYDRAISTGTWTLPSHASLFTGKFPSSHGARFDPQGAVQLTNAIEVPKSWPAYNARALNEDEMTLASVLQEAGYHTGAVVAGPWLKRVFGLQVGFDFYDDTGITVTNGRLAADVTDAALRWLDQTANQERFLFLNYFDPHGPYQPPDEFARLFAPQDGSAVRTQNVDLYDGEIRYMDHHLGRFIEGLKERGLYDRALIVITADHGELFGEHGEIGHGETPYQEVVHVPLIVKDANGRGAVGRSDALVQLTDVMPLVLHRLDLPIPQGIQGETPPNVDHPIIVESRTLPTFSRKGHWLAIFDGEQKLIWNSKGKNMLFDLAQDPDENNNIIASHDVEARALAAGASAYLRALPQPGPQSAPRLLDPETEEALRALGYLE